MEPRTPRKRRTLITLSVMALVAAMLLPTAAFGGSVFDDVADDHTHAADIEWLADTGITKGCNPPGNTNFCPENPVTRAQMATFMKRLNNYLNANFLAIDGKAENADSLDGKDSSEFVQKGEADSVTPAMLTAPAGVAQAIDDSDTWWDDTANLLSVTIEVPGPGVVHVQSTFELYMSHSNGSSTYCAVQISDTSGVMGSFGFAAQRIASSAPTGIYSDLASASRAYEVASAGSVTYYLVGDEGASSNCNADDKILTAAYYPAAHGTIDTASVAGGSGTDG